jgi:hypothetical protein
VRVVCCALAQVDNAVQFHDDAEVKVPRDDDEGGEDQQPAWAREVFARGEGDTTEGGAGS